MPDENESVTQAPPENPETPPTPSLKEAVRIRRRVLIADDDRTSLLIMHKLVERLGYQPVPAKDGLEAWNILSGDDPPQMALLDWMMPGMNGPDIIGKVRGELKDRYIYLIIVSGKNTKEDIIKGINQGADDYVVKPYEARELNVRLRAGLRIVQMKKELIALNRRLDEITLADALGRFARRLERFRAGTKNPSRVVVAIADIDRMKFIKDTYGFEAGETVLALFLERVRPLLGPDDILSRTGDDHVLLIASGADEIPGHALLERVRQAALEKPFVLPEGELAVTCCLGGCNLDFAEWKDDLAPYLRTAGKALDQSRSEGGNRLTFFAKFQ